MKLHLRRNHSFFRNHSLKAVFLAFCLLMTGCSENEELTKFEADMTAFHDNIVSIASSMETIDPSQTNAVALINDHLSLLETEFEVLAGLPIPSQFSSVETLADDAYDYMHEAARLYREAHGEDFINESFIQAAGENYESAMKRVDYIASLLQGEIPEGATVTTEDGNEFEPYSEETE